MKWTDEKFPTKSKKNLWKDSTYLVPRHNSLILAFEELVSLSGEQFSFLAHKEFGVNDSDNV